MYYNTRPKAISIEIQGVYHDQYNQIDLYKNTQPSTNFVPKMNPKSSIDSIL